MSQQLTLEISDAVYADLQHKSNTLGISVTEWIVAVLTKQDNSVSSILLPPEYQERARQRFRSHAGAISLGDATGADNQEIDADLAKAYADEY